MRLATRTFGPGGRRILLLHGIGSDAAGWWRVGADLAVAGWEVEAPDRRGHANTGPASSDLFAEHAADVVALGGQWDAVLGHSMSGAIAGLAAHADPGWAEGLIPQDPVLVVPPSIDRAGVGLAPRPLPATDKGAAAGRRKPALGRRRREGQSRCFGRRTAGDGFDDHQRELAMDAARPDPDAPDPHRDHRVRPGFGGLLPVTVGRWLEASNPFIEYLIIPGSTHSAHRDADAYETYRKTLTDGLARPPTLRREHEGGAGR